MKQLSIPETAQTLVNENLTTTSLLIAEKFNKRHDNVVQAINRLDIPKDFNALNFKVVEYLDAKGEKRKAYNITRDGFVILVMGFTGKAAMEWKLKFLDAFNAMEAQLTSNSRRLDAPSTVESRKSLNELVRKWLRHCNLDFQDAYRMINNHMGTKHIEELAESQLEPAKAFVTDMIAKTTSRLPSLNSERIEAARLEHHIANGKFVQAGGGWPEHETPDIVMIMEPILRLAAMAEDVVAQYHMDMAVVMRAKTTLLQLQKALR